MTLLNWEYEKEEREMLLSLAKDGDTFFDIGANAGLYSITFAKRYPKSRVYAFEPIPVTIAELESNLELNRSCDILLCRV
jgi:tRNA G37 N-methylase Trm5